MSAHGGSERPTTKRTWRRVTAGVIVAAGVGAAGIITAAASSDYSSAEAHEPAIRGARTVVVPPPSPGGSGGIAVPGGGMQIAGLAERPGSGFASNSVHRSFSGYAGSFNGTGEVRITCGVSHHAYDDPIVSPGQPGAAHMHTFFGNAGVNASSTYESLRNAPEGSTCAGGAVNKSSYWFPSLIDGAQNTVVEPTLTFVYYKTGYWGQDGRDIVDIPDGLRMVAGDASARSAQADWNVNWSCSTHRGGVPSNEVSRGPAIQPCSQGLLLGASIMFPQCWNGTDLDSPDHKSHMAHPNFQGRCPSSHPHLLPQITIHATWAMGPAGSSNMYLSSDMMTPPGAPAGQGLHADFFDAWEPQFKQAFVDQCLNGRRDCGVRALGDQYDLLDINSFTGTSTATLRAQSQRPAVQPPATQPPATQPPATQPPATQPPATQPPVTQPPVTQPPVTQPPVTQPPATQPPTTPAPTTPPTTAPPVSTSPPPTPPPTGGSMQLPGIDARRGPGGASNSVLRTQTGYTGTYNGLGDVRITCGVSHHAYDDPIVSPGRTGASHLHTFFGNAGTNANSTYESLRNEPQGSTCAGGSLNKSAYWFPSLIDSSSNSIVDPTLTYVYYKTGYWGQDGRDVQDIPDGLRMVAGNAAASSPQPEWNVSWACSTHRGGVPTGQISRGGAIQSCSQGQLLEATIMFPQCWNGTDLDSPDHKSHMSHPSFQGQCPSSHPVLLPQITVHATWVMGAAGSGSLYLASDMMTPDGAAPGLGLHADFFDGWDRDAKEALVDNCLNGRRDCGVRSLGDGYLLTDVPPGRTASGALVSSLRAPAAVPSPASAALAVEPTATATATTRPTDTFVCTLHTV